MGVPAVELVVKRPGEDDADKVTREEDIQDDCNIIVGLDQLL